MSSAFIPLSRRADKWHSRAPELYPVWSIDGITQWKRLLYIYIYVYCASRWDDPVNGCFDRMKNGHEEESAPRGTANEAYYWCCCFFFFSFYFFLLFLYLYSSFSFFFFFVFFSRGQWSSDDRWIASLGNLHVRFCFFERIGNELVWSCIVERAVHNDSFILCEYRKKKKMKVYKRI